MPAHLAVKPVRLRLRLRKYLVDHRVRLTLGIYAISIAIGFGIGARPHDLTDFRDAASITGLVLLLSGLSVRSWAAGVLRKGNALTTDGPYRLCRNPLYLGTFMLLTGFAIIFPGPLVSLPSLGLIAVLLWVTIIREEDRMIEKYGNAWFDYAARTPRLFPFRPRLNFLGHWSSAQWHRSREYNAVAVALAMMVGLKLWHDFWI